MLDEMAAFLEAFHWIRPAWLVGLPIFGLIWWLVRRRERAQSFGNALGLPEHLLRSLTVNRSMHRGIRPVDLIMATFLLVVLAAAGPSWGRIQNPFFAETAPLIVALELTDTMLANDVLPTRLSRAKLKLLDLMSLRAGGRTALIAFAGSAHLVLPPSEDPEIVKPFLEGLEPEVMPRRGVDGMSAVSLAHELLAREGTPGSILLVTDGLGQADVAALSDYRARPDAAPIVILGIGTEAGGVSQRADGAIITDSAGRRLESGVNYSELDRFAKIKGVSVFRATVDNADLGRIQRRVESNLQNALDQDVNAAWDDRGWLLSWPTALLMLLWFRRGWTMQWAWLLALGIAGSVAAPQAQAGPIDWFLTPDQQGRLDFENKRFEEAADHFVDPMWKGIAAYHAGNYQEAAESFARVQSVEALLNLGNAYVKAREYALAVDAYKLAVAEAPDHEAARRNLEVAQYIVKYLNAVRLASDTGDETELGADGFKFDNTVDEGTEIVITDASRLESSSEDQWMRAVDTESSEFLRIKFAVEAEAAERP
jgi:Ca-activated chloride channel family protein